jgi:hypothetical protein
MMENGKRMMENGKDGEKGIEWEGTYMERKVGKGRMKRKDGKGRTEKEE